MNLLTWSSFMASSLHFYIDFFLELILEAGFIFILFTDLIHCVSGWCPLGVNLLKSDQ